MSARSIRAWPFVLLTVFVCAAGTLTGWFFGALAGMGYGVIVTMYDVAINPIVSRAGHIVGALSGFAAGAVWCRVMIPKPDKPSLPRPVLAGAITGVAVGVLSTIVLHAGLAEVADGFDPRTLLVGISCGVVAGLILGSICGALCGWVAGSAGPTDAPWTPTPLAAADPRLEETAPTPPQQGPALSDGTADITL